MIIEELHEAYRQIMLILENQKDVIEDLKQKSSISCIIYEFNALYNTIIKDYKNNECSIRCENEMTEVIHSDKNGWRLVIDNNHWSFSMSFTTASICPPAYETYIRESLDYYPCNNENVIEWSFESFDFGALSQQRGSDYKVKITNKGDLIIT